MVLSDVDQKKWLSRFPRNVWDLTQACISLISFLGSVKNFKIPTLGFVARQRPRHARALLQHLRTRNRNVLSEPRMPSLRLLLLPHPGAVERAVQRALKQR